MREKWRAGNFENFRDEKLGKRGGREIEFTDDFLLQTLLERGSDINAQIETNRNTALTLACFQVSLRGTVDAGREYGSVRGMLESVHAACLQGRTEVVELLLAHNANVEHRAKVRVGRAETGSCVSQCVDEKEQWTSEFDPVGISDP